MVIFRQLVGAFGEEMKTWLTIFLPDDEYKERQMLHFLAEAAVLQVILLIGLMMAIASSDDTDVYANGLHI